MKSFASPSKAVATWANSTAQRVSQPAKSLVNNRPQAVAQRKLQQAASTAMASKSPIQRVKLISRNLTSLDVETRGTDTGEKNYGWMKIIDHNNQHHTIPGASIYHQAHAEEYLHEQARTVHGFTKADFLRAPNEEGHARVIAMYTERKPCEPGHFDSYRRSRNTGNCDQFLNQNFHQNLPVYFTVNNDYSSHGHAPLAASFNPGLNTKAAAYVEGRLTIDESIFSGSSVQTTSFLIHRQCVATGKSTSDYRNLRKEHELMISCANEFTDAEKLVLQEGGVSVREQFTVKFLEFSVPTPTAQVQQAITNLRDELKRRAAELYNMNQAFACQFINQAKMNCDPQFKQEVQQVLGKSFDQEIDKAASSFNGTGQSVQIVRQRISAVEHQLNFQVNYARNNPGWMPPQ